MTRELRATCGVALFVAALGACATPTVYSPTSSVPPPPTQLDVDRGAIAAPRNARWCAEDAAPVEASAPPEIANGVNALASMNASELKKHLRAEVQARIERASLLHDASAELYSAMPLDPMHGAENEVAALLAEGRACNAALVIGEMRIDFPPPFNDTRDENAQEIDAVHELIYAGTSVTAYCGPCAIYALIVAPSAASEGEREGKSGALDVLAWDPLIGGDPLMH